MPHRFGLQLIRIYSLSMAFFRHVMTMSIVRLRLFLGLQLLNALQNDQSIDS